MLLTDQLGDFGLKERVDQMKEYLQLVPTHGQYTTEQAKVDWLYDHRRGIYDKNNLAMEKRHWINETKSRWDQEFSEFHVKFPGVPRPPYPMREPYQAGEVEE